MAETAPVRSDFPVRPTTEAAEFRRLLNFIQEPVFILQVSGLVEAANAGAKTFLGSDPAGAGLADFLADDPERLPAYLRRCSGSGSPVLGSLLVRTPGGGRKVQVQGAAFDRRSAAGAPGGVQARVILRFRADALEDFSVLGQKVRDLNREVRQRRRIQAALEEALLHKETLLRELHHRVKNHTQMLLGMFSLAAREAGSEETRRFIEAMRSRLLAIGAAQQLMYHAGQLESVSARDFVASLCGAIGESWPEQVALSSSADDLELRNDVTTSLALIINELAANALKHGLRFGPGRVAVTLRRDGGDLVLTVWDSGNTWVERTEARRSSGLSLVRGLCRQIGGGFDIGKGEGTSCVVRFPYTPLESPKT